jgi:hypothetical protein
MRVENYFPKGKRWWVRLHEKGGKRHEMPAHRNLEAYLDAYIEAAKIRNGGKTPLFRSAAGRLAGGEQKLLDIGFEALAVDGALEQAGRVDAVVAESAGDGLCPGGSARARQGSFFKRDAKPAPGLHRRDLDEDQYDASVRLGAEGTQACRQGSPRPFRRPQRSSPMRIQLSALVSAHLRGRPRTAD